MTTRPRWRVAVTTTTLATTAALLSGCGVGLEDLPLPQRGDGGGDFYSVTAEFTNALNLPERAKVRLAGADVGEVSSMTVRDYTAVVTLRIRDDVTLPVGTGAELRTATPLGEVFVAVTPPKDPSTTATIQNGDKIPLSDTSAAATIEQVLASSAMLVNGGVLRDLTKLLNGLGDAVGDKGAALADLVAQSTSLIDKLSKRSGDIRVALAQTDRLVQTLSARQSTLTESLAAAGPAIDVISANTDDILALVDKVGAISTTLSTFPSVATGKTQHLAASINRISYELNKAATDPRASLAKMNKLLPPVLKIINSTGAHVDADLEDLSVGALGDFRHSADPGSRVPGTIDIDNFAGTIMYSLLRLKMKFGPGDDVLDPRTPRSQKKTQKKAQGTQKPQPTTKATAPPRSTAPGRTAPR
ncbi:MCE family protein [Gordonia amarae]|uniref:MCE family protein n=1 Tax=Gordonia amarae TaxID=36821 RepID=A0A857KU44_9ACTN|nr:MCE family protein [Gordonia amarae]QHN21029.1 MCE family protein [Gordonia amarae]QHN29881.1 MCE family protein [Gordonia amarae]QHN38656.1 MCE family protein [Gordonia amarae]